MSETSQTWTGRKDLGIPDDRLWRIDPPECHTYVIEMMEVAPLGDEWFVFDATFARDALRLEYQLEPDPL